MVRYLFFDTFQCLVISIRMPKHRRRTKSIELYQSADPEWEVVLDVDALGAAEGESWVYKGNSLYDVSEVRLFLILCALKQSRADILITSN